MTTALALLTSEQVTAVKTLAEMLAQSRYFKEASDKAKAAVKILYGAELGLGPVQALLGIDFNEKASSLSLRAHTMASLIKSSKRYDYRVTKGPDDNGCEITFFEIDWNVTDASGPKKNLTELGKSFFGPADAKRAGLAGRSTYQQHPYDMYYNRAMSKGCRMHCPDVFGAPVYSEGEVDAVFRDADAPVTIDAKVVPSETRADLAATASAAANACLMQTIQDMGMKPEDLPPALQPDPVVDATPDERAAAQAIMAAADAPKPVLDATAQGELDVLGKVLAEDLAKRIHALPAGANVDATDATDVLIYVSDYVGGGDAGKKTTKALFKEQGVEVKKGATVTREQAICVTLNAHNMMNTQPKETN